MTHVTDERKAQLDAAAEERAAYLEEVKHPVAGLHVQSLIDEPKPYHAGQLTPAYHVPGNVVAEDSAKEATLGEQSDPTPNSGETTLPTDPLPAVQSNTSSETEQSNG